MKKFGYDVKIRLDDFRPLTWRDLIIPGNITFHELHLMIQCLMDFYNYHLYQFEIPKENIVIKKVEEDDILSMFDMGVEELNSEETTIEKYFDENKKIFYVYDFGDSWSFTIEVKKKVDYDKPYPTLKRFKGEYNPVEDCGGVWGLEELIEEDSDELTKIDLDKTQEHLKNWEQYGDDIFF